MIVSTVAIRSTLSAIRASIGQQALPQLTSAEGLKINEPGKDAFWRKLGLQEARLRSILRQLQGRQHAHEHERSLLWRIPRDRRYPAQQSMNDREAVTLDLVELAETTLRELLEFSGDLPNMKPVDWEKLGEDVMSLAGKVDKAVLHATVQQLHKGPAFTVANAHPGLNLDQLSPLVGLLMAVIASKLRRGKNPR